MRAPGTRRWTMSTSTAVSFCHDAASATRPKRPATSSRTCSGRFAGPGEPALGLDELIRQLLGPPGRLDAAREVAERLAVVVVLLVEREDPQQRLVEVPVRDLLDHDL